MVGSLLPSPGAPRGNIFRRSDGGSLSVFQMFHIHVLFRAGKAARVKIGGVLRGVLPRSLGRLRRLRPAGFGWGRARLNWS